MLASSRVSRSIMRSGRFVNAFSGSTGSKTRSRHFVNVFLGLTGSIMRSGHFVNVASGLMGSKMNSVHFVNVLSGFTRSKMRSGQFVNVFNGPGLAPIGRDACGFAGATVFILFFMGSKDLISDLAVPCASSERLRLFLPEPGFSVEIRSCEREQ